MFKVKFVEVKTNREFCPDKGCEYAPKCLECPFERCRYDEAYMNRKSRNVEMINLVKSGKSVAEVSSEFKVSRRNIYRIIALNG